MPEDVLADAVHLDVNLIPCLFIREREDALRVGDEHDPERGFRVVDGGDGQTRAIDRDKPLQNHIRHEVRGGVAELKGIPQTGSVGDDLLDSGYGVDMALHDMPAEALVRGHCALAVDPVADDEVAEVRERDCLGREADLERRGVEFKHGQARAVDADRVADVAVVENRRRVRERQDVLGPVGALGNVRDGRDMLDLVSGGGEEAY